MIVDTSGSFSDDLAGFKTQARGIVENLVISNPNTRFGLATFEDYPIPPFGDDSSGDAAYRRNMNLTPDTEAFLAAVDGLSTRFGDDAPESQLVAVFQAATGLGQDLSASGYPEATIPAGLNASFRVGAQKIMLLWTDASFHLPEDDGSIPYPGPSLLDTFNAVLALDPPKVIGISVDGGGASDLALLAEGTNTTAPVGGVDCDGDGDIDVAEGEPLVCETGASGDGLSGAVEAGVEAIAGQPYWWAGSHLVGERYARRIELSWPSAVDREGISEYRIFKDGTLHATVGAATTSLTIPGLVPSTSYELEVQAADGDGNATLDGPVATMTTTVEFVDTAGHVFVDDAAWLAGTRITLGCNPPANDAFCPDEPVTRGQMAAFLARALQLEEQPFGPGASLSMFVDSDGHLFANEIAYLAMASITRGCNPPTNDRFCPDQAITRGQMAAFLVRALELPEAPGDPFNDDNDSTFETDIERLAASGITRGCNPPVNDQFCPNQPVTRGQMAAFLHRGLG